MPKHNKKIPVAEPVVRVKRRNNKAKIPLRQKDGDAGFDLATIEDFTLKAGERCIVPTGLAFGIPHGYYGQIKPRSGLASKGVTVDAGVIDRGYTGEVKVILCNFNKEGEFKFNVGDRIAQILFLPVLTTPLVEVDELEVTDRGDKGFGSTGRSSSMGDRLHLERYHNNPTPSRDEEKIPDDWARDLEEGL